MRLGHALRRTALAALVGVLPGVAAGGDGIVLFTDGVPEAQNRDGELYGYDAPKRRLAELDTAGCTTQDILQHLIAGVERFRHGAPARDDMAIVVISVARAT